MFNDAESVLRRGGRVAVVTEAVAGDYPIAQEDLLLACIYSTHRQYVAATDHRYH